MMRRIRLLATVTVIMLIAGPIAIVARKTAPHPSIEVTAMFSKTIGLFPSSRVDVLGVPVGRVVSVTPMGADVKVVMRIDRDRRIPADARATIVPISLISDRYVQLFPPYRSGARLQNGDVIGTDRTFVPAELDDLLTQLKKLLDALQTGTPQGSPALGAMITNLAAALRGTGADLSTTLSGGGKVAGTVLARSSDLDGTIVHLSALIDALASRRTDLVQLNTHLAEAMGAIATERQSLGGALSNIALLTEQLSSLVHDHKAALETDLNTLAKTTQAVVAHQDSLIQTLSWLPVLDDGVEAEHNGGAVHIGSGNVPTHIDVRDSHLATCPPSVPVMICDILSLNASAAAGPSAPGAAPSAPSSPSSPSPSASPAPSLPIPVPTPSLPDLLDLLRASPSGTTSQSSPLPSLLPSPTSTPGGLLGGLFDAMGGAVDTAWRWIW